MEASESARRMVDSLLEERTPVWRLTSHIDDHRSRSNNSSEVEDILYRDIAKHWSAIPIQSPARAASSSSDIARHPNGRSRRDLNIAEDLQGGYHDHLDTNDDERWQTNLSPPLQQPHQQLSPLPFRAPSVQSGNREETLRVIPSINPLEFYQQRKEMISRHHWKLTNQNMRSSNAQRCIRMLTKHHSKLEELTQNLTNDNQAEPQLRDWLIREHGNLLHTSRLVLTYFERSRMHLCR